jgi:serine/threonine protein kinase
MIGKTISHYKIEAELGHGGMGVVYRALDQRLRRKVALKLLPEAIGSHAERRARVMAEARTASVLNHPGITTIYEVGEHDEQVFIVMELVPGRSLPAVIAEGALEPKAIVRLGASSGSVGGGRTRTALYIATSSRKTSWCSRTGA